MNDALTLDGSFIPTSAEKMVTNLPSSFCSDGLAFRTSCTLCIGIRRNDDGRLLKLIS